MMVRDGWWVVGGGGSGRWRSTPLSIHSRLSRGKQALSDLQAGKVGCFLQ